jgi:hypothetical protein
MNTFGKDVDPRIMYLYEPTKKGASKVLNHYLSQKI